MKRVERLEAASGVHSLGYYHLIYASDAADYQVQRSALIASGKAKASDFMFDENEGLPVEQRQAEGPQTIPWSMSHDDWVLQMDEEHSR
ncbi:hypothetical protein [Microvirga pudoricolor]|uniref:hypothetical protein n=1 Tax=Microvirga pudoricolor TaxID=2778729 RepID=UPI00194ED05F|nr:hypothetical protein [Microvirga pudoricolor]MBM6593738.1 hypothetical protein [Microvirga pudoricolor]